MKKAANIPKVTPRMMKLIGESSLTSIKRDAEIGVGQDNRKFPRYKAKYADAKSKGFKNYQVSFTAKGKAVNFTAKRRPKKLRGISLNRQVSPPNLVLTGAMQRTMRVGKATEKSVTIIYPYGTRVSGNADRGRDIYGLNEKNLNKAGETLLRFLGINADEYMKEKIVFKVS